MEKSRLELLEEALRADPEDTFARYALALELAKAGRPEAAWQQFDYLLAHHPEYSPTYYQAGMFLVSQGRKEEARAILARGVEVARREGNLHAQTKVQEALDLLAHES